MSFIVAARMLRIPTVCLPHGLSVKLDPPTEEAMRLIGDGSLDWSDRNRFAAYVLNTEHHRQIHLDHGGGDPAVMQTWGSLRWDPAWFDLNRKLVDPIAWPDPDPARLKVLFMVPKWQNRVDAQAAVELFKRIRALPFVSLAVVGHPRGRAESDPLYADAEIDWDGVHDLSGVNSVALIAASDVVVDVGSSIGLEVVMQGKVLVNPEYVHDVATLFDTVPGCCVVAHSADDVARYLSGHAAGRPHVTTATALSELLRHAVYGGREEPFDVIGLYHARVTELARG
jgi:hypothetical protein